MEFPCRDYMERRIKYIKKNKEYCYAVQVKKWLFWKTIYTDFSLTNIEKFIDTLDQIDEFNNNSLNKIVCDGWAVKNLYKSGPDCFIKFYQSYPSRRKIDDKFVIVWEDSNGFVTSPIQFYTEKLFGKECIEQPMKLRITIEQIGE